MGVILISTREFHSCPILVCRGEKSLRVNIEDDVAASLKRLEKARRLKFNALLNLVLREVLKV